MNLNNNSCDMEHVDKGHNKALLFFTREQVDKTSRYVVAILMTSILCVFINPSLQTITGPIMAICFTYLYFNGYKAFVTSIIIVANDALRCIFFGSISFPYLLLLFLGLALLSNKHKIQIRISQMIAAVILVIMLVTLYHYSIIGIKNIIYTLTFICAGAQCVSETKERELFFKGIAITVFLISLHTCVTGGVEFYELNEYSKAFLRKGILGVGIGDSNFSSLLLNIGIAITLFDTNFKWYLKTIMIACSVFSMTVTLSTSGLIGFLLVLGCFVFIKRDSIPKKIWNALFIIFFILIIINVYMAMPDSMRNETIDAYIARMQEKFFLLNLGNMTEFTSSRSELLSIALQYIFSEQGIVGLLFGFNSLFAGNGELVPHNTYVDLLLQIGLIGTAASLAYILRGVVTAWRSQQRSRTDVMVKIVFLYYFFNLSLFHGSMFALAYIVLVIL